jgi:hypothetical protein
MTPKEKAEELYSNYLGLLIKNSNTYIDNGLAEEQAKQCALIAVNQVWNVVPFEQLKYWGEVKQEINYYEKI